MNPKLKLAFIKQSNEKGFAFPLAMLVGLIMVVTGMSMVMRSQSDQSKVAAQQVKAESLSVTEVGVAQIQDYLNSFRVLATYPSSCETLERDSISSNNNDCWAKIQTSSRTSTSSTPAFQPKVNEVINACSASSSSDASRQLQAKLEKIKELTEDKWHNIGDSGQYKFISYEYQPDPGVSLGNAPGTGILTIQGRDGYDKSNRSASNSSTTSSPSPTSTPANGSGSGSSNPNPPIDNSESNNILRVRIPIIVPALPDIFNSTLAPGLWIKEGATNDGAGGHAIGSDGTYSAGSNFNASVAMSDDCSFRSSSTLRKNIENFISSQRIQQMTYKDEDGNNATTEYKAQFVDLDFPELPIMPTDNNRPLNNRVRAAQQNLTLNSTESFPRTGDTQTTVNRQRVYEYIIDSINLSGNKEITITPGEKVIFYVKGDITGNGTGGIKHDCTAVTTTTTTVDRTVTTVTSKTTSSTPCKPTDFQIYAYNSSNSTNPQICLKGGSQLEAFIFAPQYALGKTGNGTFIGSLWGKSWGKIATCGSNNGKVAVIQGASWELLPAAMKPQPAPRIAQVTTWEQIPVEKVVTTPPTTTTTTN